LQKSLKLSVKQRDKQLPKFLELAEAILRTEKKKIIILTMILLQMMILKEKGQTMRPTLKNMEQRTLRMIKKVELPKIKNIRTILRVNQNLTKIQMKLIILSKNL
jgi:hypothetical protein